MEQLSNPVEFLKHLRPWVPAYQLKETRLNINLMDDKNLKIFLT